MSTAPISPVQLEMKVGTKNNKSINQSINLYIAFIANTQNHTLYIAFSEYTQNYTLYIVFIAYAQNQPYIE